MTHQIRLLAHLRKQPTAELERALSVMPSPDEYQGKYDREENVPAIQQVLREREKRSLVHVRLDWLIDVRGTDDPAVAIGAARDYIDGENLGDFVTVDALLPVRPSKDITVTLYPEGEAPEGEPTYDREHIESLVHYDVMTGYQVAGREEDNR